MIQKPIMVFKKSIFRLTFLAVNFHCRSVFNFGFLKKIIGFSKKTIEIIGKKIEIEKWLCTGTKVEKLTMAKNFKNIVCYIRCVPFRILPTVWSLLKNRPK